MCADQAIYTLCQTGEGRVWDLGARRFFLRRASKF
jgi:hypothetical protein